MKSVMDEKPGEDSMNIKTIDEEAIGGSNSAVLKDVESWSISVVSLCKKIGRRCDT